jgi:hypothetical protein
MTRITHREFLGDITGSTAFAIQKTLSVNPGLSSTFPWLCNIARQYETYYVRSLAFEYETQESTATAGTVMMAVDYDPSDDPPQNKTQLLSYKAAVRSPGWAPCKFLCNVPDLSAHGAGRFVRAGLIANTDIKLYDVGNFHIATQGFAGATVAGELYVSYVIDFMTPQSDPDAIRSANSRVITSGGTDSRAAPFGDAATYAYGLNVTATGATLSFNEVGEYLIMIQFIGTVVTNVSPTLTGTAAGKSILRSLHANAAATEGLFAINARINNIGETVIFDFTACCDTLTSSVTDVASYVYY